MVKHEFHQVRDRGYVEQTLRLAAAASMPLAIRREREAPRPRAPRSTRVLGTQ